MSDSLTSFFRASRVAFWVVLAVLAASAVYAGAMSVLNWGEITV